MVGAVLKGALRRALARFGLELRRTRAHRGVPQVEDVGFSHVLEVLFGCIDGLELVQVGANDGVQGDLLCPFLETGNPRGILVEPQAEPFRRLQERYCGREGLRLYRGAIDTRSGLRTLYRCRDDLARGDAAARLSGLASFDRAQVVRSYRRHARRLGLGCPPEAAIVAEDVPTITLEGLLRQHGQRRCDLLALDTEGYDFEIIKGLDFAKIRPLVLIYEHIHLCRADSLACWHLLAANGYRCAAGWSDTLAIRAGQSSGAARTEPAIPLPRSPARAMAMPPSPSASL
jgi:FkbM family methyltransferase